jgi:DNA-directed RNA polymerase subunit K/omega
MSEKDDQEVEEKPVEAAVTEISSELIERAVNEKLKEIKANLDKAYGVRDEALKKVAEFEKKEREIELKRLEEEGKHREAFEMKLAELASEKETLEKRNIELSRDLQVKDLLKGIQFRSAKAADVAFREISSSLVKGDNGKWIHSSGKIVSEFIEDFIKDEDNAFLLRQKVSNGPGLKSTDASNSSSKSLYEMTQEEVLKLAAEGKLPRRK